MCEKLHLKKQLESGPSAQMAAERTSLHRRSQTVLQEIRDALPTHTYQGPWPKRNWLIMKRHSLLGKQHTLCGVQTHKPSAASANQVFLKSTERGLMVERLYGTSRLHQL